VIVAAAERLLTLPDLKGRRVLVTAGGTREPIDAVRVITNRSSGKQGYAVAAEAASRGAAVTLVTTIGRPAAPDVEVVPVETAAQMADAVLQRIDEFDVLVMAAAVADFRPVAPRADKIKKSELGESAQAGISLELEPTTDVLAALAAERRPGQTLVGFAAEHGDRAVELARRKLEQKGVDAIVVNDISRSDIGFDVDANEVTILTAAAGASNGASSATPNGAPGVLAGTRKVARAAKAEVAQAILDSISELRAAR
jgi:phosphopantothenoylcysteine decarboxylase/phosphopantothenate--cysteine ligase